MLVQVKKYCFAYQFTAENILECDQILNPTTRRSVLFPIQYPDVSPGTKTYYCLICNIMLFCSWHQRHILFSYAEPGTGSQARQWLIGSYRTPALICTHSFNAVRYLSTYLIVYIFVSSIAQRPHLSFAVLSPWYKSCILITSQRSLIAMLLTVSVQPLICFNDAFEPEETDTSNDWLLRWR